MERGWKKMIFKVSSNPNHSMSLFLVSEDLTLEKRLLVALFSMQERIGLHLFIGFVNYYQSIYLPSRIPQEIIRVALTAFSKISDLSKDLMRNSCCWWMSIRKAKRKLCGQALGWSPYVLKSWVQQPSHFAFLKKPLCHHLLVPLLNLQWVVSLIMLSLQHSSP